MFCHAKLCWLPLTVLTFRCSTRKGCNKADDATWIAVYDACSYKPILPSAFIPCALQHAATLQAAIRDPDPVCILENELLYGMSFPVSDEVLGADFTLPIGKAKVMREGSDVTLVAFSKMVC